MLATYTAKHVNEIETKLSQLTEQLEETRKENDFNEIYLNQLKESLIQLEEELANPPNISRRQDSSAFVTRIFVLSSFGQLCMPIINDNAKWVQNGITVAGGNGSGNATNKLYNPYGVYIDDDQTIYVADYTNHRIVEWKKGAEAGIVVAGGHEKGHGNDQLNYPTSVIVNKKSDCLIICDQNNRRVVRWPRQNGTSGEIIISNIDCWDLSMIDDEYIYVSDYKKHEVRRWKIGDTDGTVVAGGNGIGSRFDQLNQPFYIFVDQDQSVYVSDNINHRVMKWVKDAKEGIVVAGGHDQGSGLTQLSNPRGVIVDQLGTVYVADCNNHRIMRWIKETTQGSVVVDGNSEGRRTNQFKYPMDLTFDRENNLYVVDYKNDRIQKFDIE